MKAGVWSVGEDTAGMLAEARAASLERAVEHEIDAIEYDVNRIEAIICEALADGNDKDLIKTVANIIYQRKTTGAHSTATSVAVVRLVCEFEDVAQPYAYAALKARAA